jgi:hypothetical protein
VVGEMLHLGEDGRHLAADRDDVKRALALAARLGDGDPVDHLEPIFDDLCATSGRLVAPWKMGSSGFSMKMSMVGSMALAGTAVVMASIRRRVPLLNTVMDFPQCVRRTPCRRSFTG